MEYLSQKIKNQTYCSKLVSDKYNPEVCISSYSTKATDKAHKKDKSKSIYSNIDLFNDVILEMLNKGKKEKVSLK